MKKKTEKIDRDKKTVSFEALGKLVGMRGRFAATSLNDMRKAGIEGAKALRRI